MIFFIFLLSFLAPPLKQIPGTYPAAASILLLAPAKPGSPDTSLLPNVAGLLELSTLTYPPLILLNGAILPYPKFEAPEPADI